MGDLNAKVGNDNTDFERVMGKHGVGTKNDNGKRLVEYCAMNNLVIGGTLFPHLDIHKLTWNSPNRTDKNQIDHLIINGIWRRSLLDVKVKRGADVGSDHHLVTSLIKLKLKKAVVKTNIQRRFDTNQLSNNTVKSAFVVDLRNRFQALQDLNDEQEESDVNTTWKQIATLYTETSKEKLGYSKKQKNKDCIQQETLDATEERRKINKILLQTKSPRLRERQENIYREMHKKVKNLVRQDKRHAMEQLAAEAEEAAEKMEQGRLYCITKRVCGKFKGKSAPARRLESTPAVDEANHVASTLVSNGYCLGPRIGKGSYAKVKVAERMKDGVIVAAKIISRHRAAKEFLRRFLPREIGILLSVRHPSIVHIYEIILTDDFVCLVLEFAERGDLLSYVKKRTCLDEMEAKEIFSQVANAVSYLHGRCICHRDLKCENVLIRRDHSIALTDFGFSKLVSLQDPLSSTYCGSAAYASPELLRGKPYNPFVTDIWSLGCILFVTVSGQMPFYEKNAKKMMSRQLQGRVVYPEHCSVSKSCKDLVSKTLEPNIQRRFDIHGVMTHPWLGGQRTKISEPTVINPTLPSRVSADIETRRLSQQLHQQKKPSRPFVVEAAESLGFDHHSTSVVEDSNGSESPSHFSDSTSLSTVHKNRNATTAIGVHQMKFPHVSPTAGVVGNSSSCESSVDPAETNGQNVPEMKQRTRAQKAGCVGNLMEVKRPHDNGKEHEWTNENAENDTSSNKDQTSRHKQNPSTNISENRVSPNLVTVTPSFYNSKNTQLANNESDSIAEDTVISENIDPARLFHPWQTDSRGVKENPFKAPPERSVDSIFRKNIENILRGPVGFQSKKPSVMEAKRQTSGKKALESTFLATAHHDRAPVTSPETFPGIMPRRESLSPETGKRVYPEGQETSSPLSTPRVHVLNSTRNRPGQDINIASERFHARQEGLVTQMRRIFESKDASTNTHIVKGGHAR